MTRRCRLQFTNICTEIAFGLISFNKLFSFSFSQNIKSNCCIDHIIWIFFRYKNMCEWFSMIVLVRAWSEPHSIIKQKMKDNCLFWHKWFLHSIIDLCQVLAQIDFRIEKQIIPKQSTFFFFVLWCYFLDMTVNVYERNLLLFVRFTWLSHWITATYQLQTLQRATSYLAHTFFLSRVSFTEH